MANEVANPLRTRLEVAETQVALDITPEDNYTVYEEVYGVFNDETVIDASIAAGLIHPAAREMLTGMLWSAPLPGPAARFTKWTNENRPAAEVARVGYAQMRVQLIKKTEWRTIEGAEFEGIDDGRRPNG